MSSAPSSRAVWAELVQPHPHADPSGLAAVLPPGSGQGGAGFGTGVDSRQAAALTGQAAGRPARVPFARLLASDRRDCEGNTNGQGGWPWNTVRRVSGSLI